MINVPEEFKKKIIVELQLRKDKYGGTVDGFCIQYGIDRAVLSRINNGKTHKLLSDSKWINIARLLDMNVNEKKWNIAQTDVFNHISEEIFFCKEHSKSMIFVDSNEIGKTTTGLFMAKTLDNCFYIDASQAKTKQLFVRLLANTIGLESTGKYSEVLANLKYYTRLLPKPIFIIDEVGDVEHGVFLVIKELWNANPNTCGWYLMGAEGLQSVIDKGIKNKKSGFSEIFSRFSSKYSRITPLGRADQYDFYRKLLNDVLNVNMENKEKLNKIVKQCLTVDTGEKFGGLRRAETLLILNA